jgi:hypothetical protein
VAVLSSENGCALIARWFVAGARSKEPCVLTAWPERPAQIHPTGQVSLQPLLLMTLEGT